MVYISNRLVQITDAIPVSSFYTTDMPKRRKKTKKSALAYFIIWVSRLAVLGIILLLFVVSQIYLLYSQSLPSDKDLSEWHSNEASRIYDRNGQLLYEIYGDQKRIIVRSDAISPVLK